jgi:hypothetical protein
LWSISYANEIIEFCRLVSGCAIIFRGTSYS